MVGLSVSRKKPRTISFLLRGQRQAEGVGGLAGVQVRLESFPAMRLQQGVFVAAFDIARDLLQPLLDGLQVGQHQFGGHDLDVPHRVNVAGDVDNVRVLEAAHDLDERVHFADVAEELVAQALAVGRAFHQAGDVHELKGRRDERADLDDLAELRQARVRHADDAEVGFDGAEGIILRRGLVRAGDGVEEGGFPDVRKTDDACL